MSFTNGVSTTSLSATIYAAGTNSLTATSSSVVGVDLITVTPAGPAKLAFTPATPGPGIAGSSIPNVAVSVEDTYGNVVTSASSGSVTATVQTGPRRIHLRPFTGQRHQWFTDFSQTW